MTAQVDELRKLIYSAKTAVFFGGAGVSTESGIPDFRSEAGLYNARQVFGNSPEYLLSHKCLARQPELFFRYYKDSFVTKGAKPNVAHSSLAKLEELGYIAAVVTQNVDGLHQAAGSKKVYEIHGSNQEQYCIKCSKKYDLNYILAQDGIPKCHNCGGIVRPNITLYGEKLPQRIWDSSVDVVSSADLLIVGGTSLAVYPASSLLNYFSGNQLVVINHSVTPADRKADIIMHASIGEVLRAVVFP